MQIKKSSREAYNESIDCAGAQGRFSNYTILNAKFALAHGMSSLRGCRIGVVL
jgi:hypothetical protein